MPAAVPFQCAAYVFLLQERIRCPHAVTDGSHHRIARLFLAVAQTEIDGSTVQIMRLHVLQKFRKPQRRRGCRDAEYYAGKVKDTGGVYLVPAFTGLGAPHWDMYARGCLIGLTRGTTREHIIRAAQESIAYQVNDLLTAMKRDTGTALSSLSVDGGASRDSFLMQFQSDISDCTIRRPVIRETTALGACYLAGLATGVWHSREELKQLWRCDTLYAPSMDENKRRKLLSGWDKAVGRSLDWAEH